MKVRFEPPQKRDPETERGVKIPYAPSRRAFPRWRWYFVVLLVSSPLLFFLFRIAAGWFLVTSPAMVFLAPQAVNAPRSGVVRSLSALPGALVTSGEVLALLADDALEERRLLLEVERRNVEEALRLPPAPRGLGPLRESLRLAREVATEAAATRTAIEDLFRKGAATKAELDAARAAAVRARAEVLRAEGDLAAAGTPRENRGEGRGRLRRLEEEQRLLKDLAATLVVRSPFPGIVSEVHAAPGETVQRGAPLVTLVDPDRLEILAFLDPKNVDSLGRSGTARVRFPGGASVEVTLLERPLLAAPLPAFLMRPLSENRAAVPLRLRPLAPVPEQFRISGLPVTVYWGLRFLP